MCAQADAVAEAAKAAKTGNAGNGGSAEVKGGGVHAEETSLFAPFGSLLERLVDDSDPRVARLCAKTLLRRQRIFHPETFARWLPAAVSEAQGRGDERIINDELLLFHVMRRASSNLS